MNLAECCADVTGIATYKLNCLHSVIEERLRFITFFPAHRGCGTDADKLPYSNKLNLPDHHIYIVL